MKKIIAISSQHFNNTPRSSYIVITWRVLLRCNLDCSYCGPWLHDLTSDIPTLDKLTSAAEKLHAHAISTNKKIYYFLTGGEPYLIKEFNKFLEFLHSLSSTMAINVSSNASLPNRVYLNSIPYVNQLVLSLHIEVDPAAVEEKIKSIITLNETAPAKVTAMVMLEKGHFKQAQEIADRLKKHNVNYWLKLVQPQLSVDLVTFNPPGAKGNLVSASAKDSLINSYKEIVNDYYNKEELMIADSLSITEPENNVKCMFSDKTTDKVSITHLLTTGNNSFKGWNCYAGLLQAEIFADGNIYVGVCTANGSFGNVYSGDINWPTETIVCPLNHCVCTTDISVPKTENHI